MVLAESLPSTALMPGMSTGSPLLFPPQGRCDLQMHTDLLLSPLPWVVNSFRLQEGQRQVGSTRAGAE